MSRNYYTPTEADTPETLADKAYRCGLDLRPRDRRAAWIDETGDLELIEVYHQGQAIRYESEGW
jgi:hypothetical protein